ncbi:MAG: hypothetical protein R2682_13650 [Pyrinomonadaceae bacterium]
MEPTALKYDISDFYDDVVNSRSLSVVEWGGKKYRCSKACGKAANMLLYFAPETNGELAYRAYQYVEKKVGRPLADLAESARNARVTYKDLRARPRPVAERPCWSGLVTNGRAYAPFVASSVVHRGARSRAVGTLFYHDHEGYLAYGENLPTYKPS